MADSQYSYAPVRIGTCDQQPCNMEAGQPWRQYVIAAVANMAVICAGFSMGWTSPVNAKLNDPAQSPLAGRLTTNQIAWLGSLLTIGAIVGPFMGGFLTARIGRKWGLLCVGVPLFLGWVLVASATGVGVLYAGRVCWGVAVGWVFAVSPMYCAEIATDASRGALGSFLQSFLTLGFLLVYSVGPFVSYSGVAYVGTGAVAAFCLAFYWMPESPIYHLTKNNREAATQCLALIRGRSRASIQDELDKMEEDMRSSMGKTVTVLDVFRGSNLKAFYISCGLVFFQQFSGVNAVLFYLTDIFKAAGSSLDSAVATIIIGAVQVVASFITPFVVDRLGRRILLLASSCGTAIGLGLLGTYFLLSSQQHPLTESLSWFPVASLILFIVTFCWGLGSLPWAIMSELFPIEVKAIASPIATAFAWTCSFLTTRYFSSVAAALGMHVSFWIFGACCAGAFVFTLLVVPETKGKSFAQIQDMLNGRSSKAEEQPTFSLRRFV